MESVAADCLDEFKKLHKHMKLSNYGSFFDIEMFCVICYHLHNFKNVKNTHGGVLLLLKLQANHKVILLEFDLIALSSLIITVNQIWTGTVC